jgi:O-antigen ligase
LTENLFAKESNKKYSKFPQYSWQFWLLSFFTGAIFVAGGSARGDVESLSIIRPIAVLTLGCGLTGLTREQIRCFGGLFLIGFFWITTSILQVIPLPLSMLNKLAGHGNIPQIYDIAKIASSSGTYSLAPTQTWNSIWSAIIPLAALVLSVQLSFNEHKKLMMVILYIGIIDILLSLLQIFDGYSAEVLFYDNIDTGFPLGLFVNHNHHSTFLSSMLVFAASYPILGNSNPLKRTPNKIHFYKNSVSYLIMFITAPLILLTGSRTGIAVEFLSILTSGFIIYKLKKLHLNEVLRNSKGKLDGLNLVEKFMIKSKITTTIFLASLGILIFYTIRAGRAISIIRLTALNPIEDLRLKIIPTLFLMISRCWPFGSGFGAFKPVYRSFEATSILRPEIMNHAHNDWLEMLIMAGLPGFAISIALFVMICFRAHRTAISNIEHKYYIMNLAGFATILFFAIASITDYPLRVPSLACLIVFVSVWTTPRIDEMSRRPTEKEVG